MLSYPQLQLPETWKPLFRALAEQGWELNGNLPEMPDWTTREVLVFRKRQQEWAGNRYLTFLEEPIWCGNVRQPRGFSIVAACAQFPESREAAEQACLPLTGDWESHLPEFVQEIETLSSL